MTLLDYIDQIINSNVPFYKHHSDSGVTFEFLAPGLTRDDIDIKYHDNFLYVKINSKYDVYRGERNPSTFEYKQRIYVDSNTYDVENITSKLDKGILTINVPVLDSVKNKNVVKTISIDE